MKKEILISSAKALGRERGGGGGRGSKFSDTIITFYHPTTKMSNMRIKSFGGIHYL